MSYSSEGHTILTNNDHLVIDVKKHRKDIAEFLVGLAKSQPMNPHTETILKWALDLHPTSAAAWNGLGCVAMNNREFEKAANLFNNAVVETGGNNPLYLVNKAMALRGMGQYQEAITACHRAINIDHNLVPAWIELAGIYTELDDLELYEAALNEAVELDPENTKLLLSVGALAMLKGDEDLGWANYEARGNAIEARKELDEYEEWMGQPLAGKSIRVTWEQGFGDVIMFSRYLPALFAMKPNHIVIESRAQMARLQATLLVNDHENVEIVTRVEDGKECDYWIALGSLARHFPEMKYTGKSSYMGAWVSDIERFKQIIPETENLKVGLCWFGRKEHLNDKFRSIPWDVMKQLLDVPGCTFYSLQAGKENSGLPNLIDFCHDFADTAAAIANLDLVITCDTAVAHVAGAIGKPVWILIGKPVDWRWGLEGEKTAWYPTARLFRTPKPLDWVSVIRQVEEHLMMNVQQRVDKHTFVRSDYVQRDQQEAEAVSVGDVVVGNVLPDRGGTVVSPVSTSEDIRRDAAAIEAHELFTHDPKGPFGQTHSVISGLKQDPGKLVKTKQCKYGEMSFYTNDKYVSRCLDLYGEYSDGEVELFKLLLKPGDVVIEAGSNIGSLTVPLAQIVGKTGVVYAFEPQPIYFDLLLKNTSAYRETVRCHVCALGETVGRVKMKHVETGRIHAPGWESSGGEFTSFVGRLDALSPSLTRLTLLKVDVDGPEMEILRGAEGLIGQFRPIIYVEWDKPERYPDMLQWLTEHQYRVYHHLPPFYNPNNFNGYKLNVFEAIASSMFLCIPQENKELRLSTLPAGIRRMKQ